MPDMSGEDCSVHTDDCAEQASSWMPISNLPDEVTSIEHADCECWAAFDRWTSTRTAENRPPEAVSGDRQRRT